MKHNGNKDQERIGLQEDIGIQSFSITKHRPEGIIIELMGSLIQVLVG